MTEEKNASNEKIKEDSAPTMMITLSPEELQRIIANAMIEAEEKKNKAIEEYKEAEQRRIREKLGLQDVGRRLSIVGFLSMIVIRIFFVFDTIFHLRDDNRGFRTNLVFSLLLSLVFFCMSLLSLVWGISFLSTAFGENTLEEFFGDLCLFAFFSVLAVFFLLVGRDALDLKDSNYVMATFAAVSAFLSVMISLIAVFGG